jgi:hypothetical protein
LLLACWRLALPVSGEPQVEQAISLEDHGAAAGGHSHGPAEASVQSHEHEHEHEEE